MTVVKITSLHASFRTNADRLTLQDIMCYDKGEIWLRTKRKKYDRFGVTIGFSKRDWDDLPGQIKDAVKFLRAHGRDLRKLTRGITLDDAYIDFPVYSRFSKKIVAQQESFPQDLLQLCGKFGLGINLSIYG